MLYTSYFANLKNLPPTNYFPVSISRFPPEWYCGAVFPRLAPSEQLLSDYHANLCEEGYIRRYHAEVLEKQSIAYLLRDLFYSLDIEDQLMLRSVPGKWWENPSTHVVLLCFEKPGAFCHRHLVAEWMHTFGIPVEEWSKQKALFIEPPVQESLVETADREQ